MKAVSDSPTVIPAPVSICLDSLAATRLVGRLIGNHLPPHSICLFIGELAAGKTTLIKAICSGMGIDPDIVISPTYTITNIYEGTYSVFHVDLYRIGGADEIRAMDVDDWINPDGITLIEWPQVASQALRELPTLNFHLTRRDMPFGPTVSLIAATAATEYGLIMQVLARSDTATRLSPTQLAALWRPGTGGEAPA